MARGEKIIRKSNTTLFWINRLEDGNLAIMPAPRSLERLEATVVSWKTEGIDFIVSLLEWSEIPGMTEVEPELCREFGIEFLSFPIKDKSVPPSREVFLQLARHLADRVKSGSAVAIHCRAGIGRSTLLAAGILICLGFDAEKALDMIKEARGTDVPETEAQRRWVLEFSKIPSP